MIHTVPALDMPDGMVLVDDGDDTFILFNPRHTAVKQEVLKAGLLAELARLESATPPANVIDLVQIRAARAAVAGRMLASQMIATDR